MMTVLAVQPEEKPVTLELEGTLKSMQDFVDGTIQAIYPFEDAVAIICNDEGKLNGMKYNRALRNEAGEVIDILCGPFFVCGLGEEDFVSLTAEQLETYRKIFEHPEMFLAVAGKLIVLPV